MTNDYPEQIQRIGQATSLEKIQKVVRESCSN